MAGEKILIIDDEAVVRELISHYLLKEGFKVFTNSGNDVFEQVQRLKPDLILLDVLLPEIDGMEICRELRKETNVPIIFITSKNNSLDLALGLGVGGDDYITKPFEVVEVIARVKAHLRRYRQFHNENYQRKNSVLEYPGLQIDQTKRTVRVNGVLQTLTAKEYEILALLAKNPNHYFSPDQLIESIWQSTESVDYRTLMVHISKLRRKIERDPANPEYIITVRGMGYKFNAS